MVIAMATDWTPSLKKSCCVEFVSAATIVLLMSLAMNGVGADLVDRNCVHRITQSKGCKLRYLLKEQLAIVRGNTDTALGYSI